MDTVTTDGALVFMGSLLGTSLFAKLNYWYVFSLLFMPRYNYLFRIFNAFILSEKFHYSIQYRIELSSTLIYVLLVFISIWQRKP